ncbi:MAG: hypothetical protein QME96_17475, partial [Myxococcota bacterium]|nr:hypothetical protein [Myxococcota bacterium]
RKPQRTCRVTLGRQRNFGLGGPGAGGYYWPAELSSVGGWSFWSSSSYAGSASPVWGVYFDAGYVYSHDMTYPCYVRCVRRGP